MARLQILAVLLFANSAFAMNPQEDACRLSLRSETASSKEKATALSRWSRGTAPVDLMTIPGPYSLPPYLKQTYTLIGGRLVEISGPMDEIFSPIRVQKAVEPPQMVALGAVPRMSAEMGLAAYKAARTAWNFGAGEWPSASLEKRIQHMEKFVAGMKSQRSELIRWVIWEIAKSNADAAAEVDRTIAYIEDTIRAAKKLAFETQIVSLEKTERFTRLREPLGVGLFFAPYNYPLNETFTNLIPALIMGNTAVVKPARFGVILMNPLLRVFQESFPAGVVNFIYGDGREVLKAVQEEGGYEAFGFIGSENTAAAILRTNARPQRTKPILGLGAKNMAVVFNDADLDTAVQSNLTGCLSFNGQRCTAHKILFVQRGIAQKFVDKFSAAVDALNVGQPWTDKVNITPSPDTGWVARMDAFKDDAVAKGARVANLIGGKRANGFYAPTVLVDVTPEMNIYNEEQFGTIVPIVIFDDIETPLQWQRQSRYGQQAALYSQSAETLNFMSRNLRRMVGRVNINTACRRSPDSMPFSARGDSGQVTLSLVDALLAYTTDAVICEETKGQTPKVTP